MNIKNKYFNIKNIYDKVNENHNRIKQPPEYLLVVMIDDDMSCLGSNLLKKDEKDNNDIYYFNMFNLGFDTLFGYGDAISLNKLKENFNLLLFDFNLDFDKFTDNYTSIRNAINKKHEYDYIILNNYKIRAIGSYLRVYKRVSSDYYEEIYIYNRFKDIFNKEFFDTIIDFDYEKYRQNTLIITNGRTNINLLDENSGDIGCIIYKNDNLKIRFIGIKDNDIVRMGKQMCFIGDKTFIRLDGINDILRMKIKNNKVNDLKEDDKKELDRLLSLYENMGFSIKE